MAAEPSDLDPRALWKALDPEADPVTLDKIHASAGKLDRAARLTLLIIPLYLAACAFSLGGTARESQRTKARAAANRATTSSAAHQGAWPFR